MSDPREALELFYQDVMSGAWMTRPQVQETLNIPESNFPAYIGMYVSHGSLRRFHLLSRLRGVDFYLLREVLYLADYEHRDRWQWVNSLQLNLVEAEQTKRFYDVQHLIGTGEICDLSEAKTQLGIKLKNAYRIHRMAKRAGVKFYTLPGRLILLVSSDIEKLRKVL